MGMPEVFANYSSTKTRAKDSIDAVESILVFDLLEALTGDGEGR